MFVRFHSCLHYRVDVKPLGEIEHDDLSHRVQDGDELARESHVGVDMVAQHKFTLDLLTRTSIFRGSRCSLGPGNSRNVPMICHTAVVNMCQSDRVAVLSNGTYKLWI